MARREDILESIKSDPETMADLIVSWEEELSKVMPHDFKDWWRNDQNEWPLIARLVIENLREHLELYENGSIKTNLQ